MGREASTAAGWGCCDIPACVCQTLRLEAAPMHAAGGTQSATAIRDSIFTASYLGLCPSLKAFLDRQQALQQAPPGTTMALAGISGGLFAAALTQPVDTAKTRMQAFIDNRVSVEVQSGQVLAWSTVSVLHLILTLLFLRRQNMPP